MNSEGILPLSFIKRLHGQMGKSGADNLISALGEDPEVSVRLNPLKSRDHLLISEPVPWCSEGWYLSERPSFTLDPHFHAGAYYVQEASSMFLEQVIRQSAGEMQNPLVLDLCGAPGGKSTHLSSLIPSGTIVANEVIRDRASVLAENVTKWGTGNIVVTSEDPLRFSALEAFFDIMVVDAPCSGEGMFRNSLVAEQWSIENTVLCAERQRRILMDAWPALRRNGLLVYSTCTFNPAENEENLAWLSDNEQVEPVPLVTEPEWGIEEVNYRGITGYAFYPDRVRGEGFFISVLRKLGGKDESDTAGRLNDLKIPGRKEKRDEGNRRMNLQAERGGGRSDTETRRKEMSGRVSGNQSAEGWITGNQLSPVMINDLIILPAAPPSLLSLLRRGLNVVKSGTILGEIKGKDIVPSHELALYSNLNMNGFSVMELSLDDALNYLRRNTVPFRGGEKGWNLVMFEGSALGWIKNIGSRYNNYYPVNWRIRIS
ncbi:MAG: rRNA cytosine-C5-methyltransferase [Bacteroidales bacterium]|nr:rRNA cytosine-C5-methyltransferase [Bacteroidales bacterium]